MFLKSPLEHVMIVKSMDANSQYICIYVYMYICIYFHVFKSTCLFGILLEFSHNNEKLIQNMVFYIRTRHKHTHTHTANAHVPSHSIKLNINPKNQLVDPWKSSRVHLVIKFSPQVACEVEQHVLFGLPVSKAPCLF